jgi:cyclase
MPAKRIIACLDIRDGRVVKGRQFRDLRDAGDPVERARAYRDDGIDEIVVLDVSATLESRLANLVTVSAIAAMLDIPLTVGGGVRDLPDVQRLLDAGADKVAINTAAVQRPGLLDEAASRFGSQCIVLSIDARRNGRGYSVASHSGNNIVGIDAIGWAREATARGAGEVLITAIDRDGERSGFDCGLVAQIGAAVDVPVIASGGASRIEDFTAVLAIGADAALGASVFHDGDLRAGHIKMACSRAGLSVRT